MTDEFRGDNAALINSIDALLSLDAAGALVPHGIGGHARGLLSAAAARLALATGAAAEQVACKAEQSRWGAHLYLCDGKDCGRCTRIVPALTSAPAEPAPVPQDEHGRKAFARYIKECEECAIVPDVAGAFHWAWTHTVSLAEASQAAGALQAVAGEVDLIEKAAVRVGMKSLLNHGAASCVYSEGCNGVSQAHLISFAREVALHCVAAMAPEPDDSPLETDEGDAR